MPVPKTSTAAKTASKPSTAAKKPAASADPFDIDALLEVGARSWDQTVEKTKQSGFDFEDGTYDVLEAGYDGPKPTEKGDRVGVTFTHTIMDGPHAKKTVYDWIGLMDSKDPTLINPWLVQRLEKLTGIEADELDIRNLGMILKDAYSGPDKFFKLTLKTNDWENAETGKSGTSQNVRLGKPIEGVYSSQKKKAGAAKPKPPVTVEEDDDEDETEEETIELEKGSEVSWSVTTGAGKAKKTVEFQGTIISINEKAETAKIKDSDGKTHPAVDISELSLVEAEEDEETEEDEDAEPFEEGQTVSWTTSEKVGKKTVATEHSGTVVSCEQDEDEEWQVTVDTGETTTKTVKGKKTEVAVTEVIAASQLTLSEDEEGEDEDDSDDEDEDSDEDAEEASYSEGDEVSFMLDDEEVSGIVDSIEDSGNLNVKVGTGKKAEIYEIETSEVITVGDDEEGDDETDEEETTDSIEKDDTVEYLNVGSKKPVTGIVLSVDEKAETCKVKTGTVTKTIKWEQISTVMKPE